VLPDGILFDTVTEIARSIPTVGGAIGAARYRVGLNGSTPAIDGWRERIPLEIKRERKNGKIVTFDLARELLELETLETDGLRMTLAMQNAGASIRPDEVLGAILDRPDATVELVREDLLVRWGGRWVNPMLAASAQSAHAHRALR